MCFVVVLKFSSFELSLSVFSFVTHTSKFMWFFKGCEGSMGLFFQCEKICIHERSKITWVQISWLSCFDATRRITKVMTLTRDEVIQIHFYILNNTDIVIPYLTAHKDIVKKNHPRMFEKWVINEHNKSFFEVVQRKSLKWQHKFRYIEMVSMWAKLWCHMLAWLWYKQLFIL